jgi:hypothetical protein
MNKTLLLWQFMIVNFRSAIFPGQERGSQVGEGAGICTNDRNDQTDDGSFVSPPLSCLLHLW